ncbi:Fic/DOC family N-terminal domain-containing protein [Microbacterium aquimaris]|uniref:Fic family protein n=1 Tax=Microbacterium aquimaris TaxID=459816 RepID=UPI002AD55994|nr:Fic/DOC family N-terminal domain-containing protein [Microbacterium aquimaris]MDZ8275334.1 Fic/DOC family N-terminal domain-containing protein [Microbacterium aquimaris]
MRSADFTSTRFGALTKKPLAPWPFEYYLPSPIPREMTLESHTVAALSRADLALGRLAGLALIIDDPALLLGPALAQEALASSRIEGTEASLSEVLSAENDDAPIENQNLREVANYLRAIDRGTTLIESWPITLRFFCALHETLLTGARGEEKSPGELRRSPVWIGSPNARPETARFIPPHHDEIGDLLGDWERFVNEPSAMPPVLRSALMHYQFETIHPFLDGNGRIGRLLIGFMLMRDGVLTAPILQISGYFEKNRATYYDRLQAVRERGEIDEWVQFFAAAVEHQANESADRVSALVRLRERYRADARGDRSQIADLIEVIFRNPVVTVGAVVKELDVTQPTASNLLHKAEHWGWVRSVGRWGRGGKERWLAAEIWATLTTTNFEEDSG